MSLGGSPSPVPITKKPAETDPAAQTQASAAAEEERRRRRISGGRASTILSSNAADTSALNIGRKILLGE